MKEAIAIVTLPNGAVIPNPGARIPANGVQPTITLGASLDAQLGLVKATTSTGITKAQQAAENAAQTARNTDAASQARDQALADDIAAMEGMTYVGPWGPEATYRINDVVTHGGDSWARLTAGSNGEPGDPQHWGLVARKGDGAGFGDLIETDITGLYESQTPPIPSAYDVAVQQGYTGTVEQWLAEQKGETGERGPEGPYGGTEVTDPQVASWVTTPSQTHDALEAAYRRSVSVLEYGATGDGDTDDTAAVQEALSENPHADVYFPPGTYRLTENLNVPAGTTVTGAGPSATLLDWSSKATWSNVSRTGFLEWEPGTVDYSAPLLADVDALFPSVEVEDGHDFAAGDIIRITSDEEVFGEAIKAEFQRIVQVEGGILHLSAATFDQYTAANGGTVERVALVTGGLHGVAIRGKGLNPASLTNDTPDANRGDNAVQVSFARDFRVSNVDFTDVENRCLRFDSVLGVTVTDVNFRFHPARVRLQYGISLNGATQMVMIRGCSSWNDRHMVTTSTSRSMSVGYSAARGVPRVITITGCTAHGSWQNPIDTHRGGEYLTVTGNALTTEAVGVKARGTQILVTGNVIVGKRESVYDTSLTGVRVLNRGEDVRITGNIIRGFYEGIRFELVDGPTRSLVVSENSILDCRHAVTVSSTPVISELRIAGNTLRSAGDGYPVFIIGNLTDVEIVGNVLDGGSEGLRMTHTSSQTVTRALIQGNTCRGQATRAMFLRNVSDALVTGNFAPGSEIRFAGNCPGVITGLNHANINDLSSPGITQR